MHPTRDAIKIPLREKRGEILRQILQPGQGDGAMVGVEGERDDAVAKSVKKMEPVSRSLNPMTRFELFSQVGEEDAHQQNKGMFQRSGVCIRASEPVGDIPIPPILPGTVIRVTAHPQANEREESIEPGNNGGRENKASIGDPDQIPRYLIDIEWIDGVAMCMVRDSKRNATFEYVPPGGEMSWRDLINRVAGLERFLNALQGSHPSLRRLKWC